MNDAVNVSDRDHDRLLELITEYAGKLRALCDGYSNKFHEGNRHIAIWATGSGFCTSLLILAWLSDHGNLLRNEDNWVNVVVGGIAVAASSWLLGYLAWLRPLMVRERFSITPFISAMEKLVSRAAFIEDHSLGSEDERLLFSLKIAEGEAALEYAALTLGKRTGSGAGLEGATRKYRSLANL